MLTATPGPAICADMDRKPSVGVRYTFSTVSRRGYLEDPRTGHLHVKFHGLRIGADLDRRGLGAALADVRVECEEAGFVHLDELHQPTPQPLVTLDKLGRFGGIAQWYSRGLIRLAI
jgi:hypothetical protein